ncbi:MAG TPA: PEGA domain-containing protein [Polyangiaceae bacterium]
MAKVHKSLTKRSVAIAMVAATLVFSSRVGAQAGSGDPGADTFVAEAKAALAAGNAHEALHGFREAWALAKTPEIAGNLAIIEASFGRHRDAAEHFQFALSHLPSDATTEQKQAVAAGLDTEKQQVVTLVIRGAPVGARLSIDGEPFGTAPYTDNLYAEPGRHDVRAEALGYQSLTERVDGSAGVTLAVQLALRPVDASPTATSSERQGQELGTEQPGLRTTAKPSPVVLVVGGGVTVAGAALGAVFLLKANTAQDEASSDRGKLPEVNACGLGTPHGAQCSALHNANVAVDRDRNVAVASFVVGGAAAAGSLVYWLWPRAKAPTDAVASAIVSPGYAAIQARWSW